MAQPLRIGINLPGTFNRLGLHMGALWQLAYSGLPLEWIVLMVGSSVGYLIAACCVSLDKKTLRRVAGLVLNLKKKHIYRLSPDLIKTGLHLLAAPCVLIISCIVALSLRGAEFRFSQLVSWGMLLGGIAGFSWLIRHAIRLFFKMESPLDTSPLFKLLKDNLDFPELFQSRIELLGIAADVATPGYCVFSNHEPRMTDPYNPLHQERYVNTIRASTALPGRFPFVYVDGKCLRDAEVWTDFPIHQFRGRCDIVFRFDYWEPLQPSLAPKHWITDLLRSFDVMRDKNTRVKMAEYEHERVQDPSLPRVVYIRASESLLRQIPDMAVHNFNPKQLARAIRLGRQIMKENLPMIRKELGLEQKEEVV